MNYIDSRFFMELFLVMIATYEVILFFARIRKFFFK